MAVLRVGAGCRRGTPRRRPRVRRPDCLVAVSLLLYASFLYVVQDYALVLAGGEPPAALVPIFSAFMVLNEPAAVAAGHRNGGRLTAGHLRLAGWAGPRRMPATSRLMGLLTLGLALPLLAALS